MIELTNISKSFGNTKAVCDISMTVNSNEVVAMLGPNGAGKTTTMRMITGYLSPDSGSIKVSGTYMHENAAKAKSDIGYLPENTPLYDNMEVGEYLEYSLHLHGIKKSFTKHVAEAVQSCGLEEVLGKNIFELSKGFRQRVGLAAALVHKPKILVLDEPTAGLDPNQLVQIRSLIRNLGLDRTVIVSTHIMQEAESMCSRAVIISGGQIVGDGKISDLRSTLRGRDRFCISVKAEITHAENLLTQFVGAKLIKATSDTKLGETRMHVELLAPLGAEDIFKWAVKEKLILTELFKEKTSLEDIFVNLTNTPREGTQI